MLRIPDDAAVARAELEALMPQLNKLCDRIDDSADNLTSDELLRARHNVHKLGPPLINPHKTYVEFCLNESRRRLWQEAYLQVLRDEQLVDESEVLAFVCQKFLES